MPWTPTYSAVFEGPIIDNVLALIERDFKLGLDYFYPDDDLPDFRERSLGQIKKLEFPCLAIGPRTNDTDSADDNSHIVQVAGVDIFMGVTDDTSESVTRRIMKYMRVMDAVLRTGQRDIVADMDNAFGVFLKLSHDYGPIGENERKSIYFRGAFVALTVNLRELG